MTTHRQDHGYLQHGGGTAGPFRTEKVWVRNPYADDWTAFFEGRWRKVHIQVNRTFIVFQGKRITIQIEGL
jgi:hypothetical protein